MSAFFLGLGISVGLSVLAYVLHRFPVTITLSQHRHYHGIPDPDEKALAWMEARRQQRLKEKGEI